MSDNQFSHAFKDVVPPAPSPDGWADGARRIRRRRTQRVTGVVAVALVALAIPVAVNLLRSDGIATPAAPPSTQPTVDPPGVSLSPAPDGRPGAAACYDAAGEAVRPMAGDGVRPGAVEAWLCGDDTQTGPLEPLVTDVDSIVEFIQGQDALTGDQVCTAEYTLAYTVVLAYPDGTTAPVAGERHGCKTIDDGAVRRGGGEELYQLTRSLFEQQRAAVGQPDEPYTPVLPRDCVGDSLIDADLGNVIGGAACLLAAGDFADPVLDHVEFSADDAARIAADLKANATQGGDVNMGTDPSISLVDAWGSKFIFWAAGEGRFQFLDADAQVWSWTPTAAVQEIIDGAAAQLAEPTPDIEPSLLDDCRLQQAGAGLNGIVRGAVCWVDGTDGDPTVVGADRLTPEQATQLAADLNANRVEADQSEAVDTLEVVLIDSSGAVVRIWPTGVAEFQYRDGDGQVWTWTPSEASQAIIDAAFPE